MDPGGKVFWVSYWMPFVRFILKRELKSRPPCVVRKKCQQVRARHVEEGLIAKFGDVNAKLRATSHTSQEP